MDCFDEDWGFDAESDPGVDPDSDPEALYLSLIADEEHPRYWSETVWSHQVDAGLQADSMLFADGAAEDDLYKEIRLSELWGHCQSRSLTMEEFLELSTLVTEVDGIRGSLCIDCTMLDRPNVSANWALATTTLCRAHLRFRLGHARIDGDSTRRSG